MTSPVPPASTGVRRRVERTSAPVLLWLSSRPAFVLPGLVVLLLIAGLASPPTTGVPLLAVLAVLLLWLSYLSWPALDLRARALRIAMLALVGVSVVQRVVG